MLYIVYIILFLLLSFHTGQPCEKTNLLKKQEEAKISSLFVRRARSLLESALIGREEHDDAVVKVVGEEEEEVEQKVRVRRRAERINNNNNKNKHVVARDD